MSFHGPQHLDCLLHPVILCIPEAHAGTHLVHCRVEQEGGDGKVVKWEGLIYVGNAVAFTQRLGQAAHGGQVVLSGSAWASVQDSLPGLSQACAPAINMHVTAFICAHLSLHPSACSLSLLSGTALYATLVWFPTKRQSTSRSGKIDMLLVMCAIKPATVTMYAPQPRVLAALHTTAEVKLTGLRVRR